MTRILASIGLAATALAAPAHAQRAREQDHAYEARQKGHVMSLNKIEAIVVPRIEASGATYLRASPEFDEARAVYRLKFQREFRIFWVDIDARSGREVGRSGR